MLNFKLCKPMIIDTQVMEIAKDLPYELEDLMHVLSCVKYVVKNNSGEYVIVSIEDLTKRIANHDVVSGTQLYGPEAIMKLCEEHCVDITPITEVDVPVDFYYEYCDQFWRDICYLFARAEQRSNRLQKLINVEAPEIIIRNETRMLIEYLEELEHNNLYVWSGSDGKHICDQNDRVIRALNDGGYSIVHGWDKEMIEQMNHDAKKFSESFELIEESTEESDGE